MTDLPGDSVTDIAIDGDREVFIGGDGDLETVSGLDAVEQSVGIGASSAVRTLVGEPLRGATYARVQQRLEDALERDPQIDDVRRVEVTTVDKSAGTVTAEVFTSYDQSFEITVSGGL